MLSNHRIVLDHVTQRVYYYLIESFKTYTELELANENHVEVIKIPKRKQFVNCFCSRDRTFLSHKNAVGLEDW